MMADKSLSRQLPPLRHRSGRCVSGRSMSVESVGLGENSALQLFDATSLLPPVEVSPRFGAGRSGVAEFETDLAFTKEEANDELPPSPWTAENALRKSVRVLEENRKVSNPTEVVQVSPFYADTKSRQALVTQIRKAATTQAALIFVRECWSVVDDSRLSLNMLQNLVLRCEERKIKCESAEDENSWTALTEDEITSLAVGISRQGEQWNRLEARLSSTPLLRPVPELLKVHLPKVKSDLCKYSVQMLIWTQKLLWLVFKLALISSTLPNQWLASVFHLCDVFNKALSSREDRVRSCLRPSNNFSDPWLALYATGISLKPVSASSLLHSIAHQRSFCSTTLWSERLFKPITPLPENMCLGGQVVEWLPKVTDRAYWTARTPSHSVAETSGYQSGTNPTTDPLTLDINTSQLGDLQMVFDNEELYIKQWLKQLQAVDNLVSHNSPSRSVRPRDKPTKAMRAEEDAVLVGLTAAYMDLFQEALQNRVGTELSNLRFDKFISNPGSTLFWPESILLLVAEKAEALYNCHDDSRPGFVLRSVALHLRMKAALCSWEQSFHKALSACADHRCPLLLSAETTVGTKAGHLIGTSMQPLLALLPHFQHNGKGRPQDLAETAVLPRLEATLKLVLWWLDGRVQQLLALWQVGQYLLITHSDLKHLVDLLKHLSTVCPTTLGSLAHPVPLEWRFHVYLVSGWWDSINNMTAQIQNVASTSIQQFYRCCNRMAADAVAAHMPQGKLWKRKYRMHGPPNAHNSYVDEVISSVLWPVLEGVKHLSMPVQISIVSMATKAFCEAWMAHICKRKIKFSLYGAQLLRLDFLQLTTWLQRLPELSVQARQSIQALDILRRLHGASLLLMRQPRSNQRFRKTKVSPAISIADVNSMEADRNECHGPLEDPSMSDSLTDEDFVPNKEEWLSLRVHGGPPRWHALWCLALPCD